MVVADVKVSWVPSVSTDVVSQVVLLKTTDGGVLSETVLGIEVDSVVLQGLSQKTDYVVVHTVTDGTQDASVSLQFNVGDLEAPQPVSGLNIEVVRVYEKTEE